MSQSLEISQHINIISLPDQGTEVAYYGYHLPYLPDFLGDHTLLGQSQTEKLAEVLGRFERFVVGLRKYRNSAFALRYITRPERGSVDVSILGRIQTASNQSATYSNKSSFPMAQNHDRTL